MLTPIQRYQEAIDSGALTPDVAQHEIMVALDDLFNRLTKQNSRIKTKIYRCFDWGVHPISGLYIWGGVGRGKTQLMDMFYQCIPFEEKKRRHFHRFMYDIHERLTSLQGQKHPLKLIAKEISQNCKVLCFDEFFVSDIGDAMILAGLLRFLFHYGVCLVATSNIPPNDLYYNGLQRSRFLAAIDLLNAHTKVMNLDGDMDFRLRTLRASKLFHVPHSEKSEQAMKAYFLKLAPTDVEYELQIEINHRPLVTKMLSDGVLWASFTTLCDSPRSAADYIELARCYHTIFISDLPLMADHNNDVARRFIALVDEFYDRNVTVILSAAQALTKLYTGTALAFEYKRTISRLTEMQSLDYLALPHLA